jgi:hypothetical protein
MPVVAITLNRKSGLGSFDYEINPPSARSKWLVLRDDPETSLMDTLPDFPLELALALVPIWFFEERQLRIEAVPEEVVSHVLRV